MRRQHPFRDTIALGGWLFADLMLGLAMLFFAANTQGMPSTPTATPTASAILTPTNTATVVASPTATRSPTPTPTVTCQPMVILKKHELRTSAGPGGSDPPAQQLKATFQEFAGQRAGLLLTFGHAATPRGGEELAARVNAVLRAELPRMFGSGTIMESFHYLEGASTGAVDFHAYFFSTACD